MAGNRAPGATNRPTRQTLTVKETAEVTGFSVRTIRARISDGTLPAYRVGPRAIRIRIDDLDRLMRRIPTAG